MPDPMTRVQAKRPPDLFDLLSPPAPLSTQQLGRVAASRSAAGRYQRITELLTERGPLAGWQIAEAIGCQLHQVSGRLTEMREQGLIEKTGERAKNLRTGVGGEVVRICSQSTEFNPREISGAQETI